jgi:hypothetical protein
VQAETVIKLCDRWHKLPSEILAEDPNMMQYLQIVHLAGYNEKKSEVA